MIVDEWASRDDPSLNSLTKLAAKVGRINLGSTEWSTHYPPEYYKIRPDIFKRDNFKCILCGSKENLCVHHCDFNKRNNDYWNLATLCIPCNSCITHRVSPKNREYSEEVFKALMVLAP